MEIPASDLLKRGRYNLTLFICDHVSGHVEGDMIMNHDLDTLHMTVVTRRVA